MRQLGRLIHRWEDNIKIDVIDIGWEGMGLIHVAQDKD
jgi:hypothetical protein